MPKDKTKSHNKILEVAKKEFLEKGFEKVSMREIARKVGMAQAGLYRHFESKEAMFNSFVDPFVETIIAKFTLHEKNAYVNYEKTLVADYLIKDNMVEIMKDLLTNYHDELRLLVCCSHGTKYQHFIDELIWEETSSSYEAFNYLKDHGIKVNDISMDELHVLITSYTRAVLEPIMHDWPLDKSMKCLDKIEEFFIPAWKLLMGL